MDSPSQYRCRYPRPPAQASEESRMTEAIEPDVHDLTDRQLLMWLEHELAPEAPAGNIAATFRITPDHAVDPERLRQAFASVVARSDALRTVFERGPRPVVVPELPVEMPIIDVRDAADPDAALRTWFDDRRRRPLPLDRRCFDTALALRRGGEVIWYLCLHHLIADAW